MARAPTIHCQVGFHRPGGARLETMEGSEAASSSPANLRQNTLGTTQADVTSGHDALMRSLSRAEATQQWFLTDRAREGLQMMSENS